jgi:hypothetical protein
MRKQYVGPEPNVFMTKDSWVLGQLDSCPMVCLISFIYNHQPKIRPMIKKQALKIVKLFGVYELF